MVKANCPTDRSTVTVRWAIAYAVILLACCITTRENKMKEG